MSDLIKKKSVVKVKNFLNKYDKNIELIILDQTARTATDAANSLNTKVGCIVKSILFKDSKNNFHLCLISGDQYASIKKISNLLNSPMTKANADECKEFTGFSIGGVSPIAHDSAPSSILIDNNLSKYYCMDQNSAQQGFSKLNFSQKKVITIFSTENRSN